MPRSHIGEPVAGNVLPKLKMLQEFGFYRQLEQTPPQPESCGAHAARHAPHELVTGGT